MKPYYLFAVLFSTTVCAADNERFNIHFGEGVGGGLKSHDEVGVGVTHSINSDVKLYAEYSVNPFTPLIDTAELISSDNTTSIGLMYSF